jgi:hypothetical protein
MKPIGIYAPSYKRAGSAITQKYFSACKYVVTSSEADAYRQAGHNIWEVPDGAQGNLSRIRNYILNTAPEPWVLLLDDDLSWIGIWEGNKHRRLSPEEAHGFIEHGFELAAEWGVKFWGINVREDKNNFREYTPFSTVSYIGGPFQAHLENPCRYSETIYLKEDYDMTLQVLNRFRSVLRLNFAHYDAKQVEQPGGCAAYRTIQREKEQNQLLQAKWGKKIVRFDSGASKAKTRKAQVIYDINPIITVPIAGV